MNDIQMYLVGGYVRDKILGVPSKDRDYSVVAPSYDAMKEEIDSSTGARPGSSRFRAVPQGRFLH